ncbi:MAG: GNAT family N-acetyltransferase [Caldilineaceae bacterium]|nr:GNAT family N-acetyltransferase [Caldilineaceae bacterium]
MSPQLRTERLVLRPLTLDDAPALHLVYGDAATMRFMPNLPHVSVEETRQHLAQALGVPGAIHWAICLGDDGDAIGHLNYLGQTVLPGLGYILRRDQWNQGYVTEACRAALDYGFDQMNLDRVELWIDESNLASQRVAQKLGFRVKGTLPLRYGHQTMHKIMQVHGMWRHEWHNTEAPRTGVDFFSAQPVLLVHDVRESAHWFRDKLGFRIDFLYGAPPRHAAVSRGDWTGRMVTFQLALIPPAPAITPAGYIYVMVGTNIDQLFDQYQSAGVDIVAEPVSQPWGMREFTIRDPNGHELRFGTQGG